MGRKSTRRKGSTMGMGSTMRLSSWSLIRMRMTKKEMMMMVVDKNVNCRPVASPPVKKTNLC